MQSLLENHRDLCALHVYIKYTGTMPIHIRKSDKEVSECACVCVCVCVRVHVCVCLTLSLFVYGPLALGREKEFL